jgi:hypothetical protein
MPDVTHFDAETNSVTADTFWHWAPAGETTSTSIGVRHIYRFGLGAEEFFIDDICSR